MKETLERRDAYERVIGSVIEPNHETDSCHAMDKSQPADLSDRERTVDKFYEHKKQYTRLRIYEIQSTSQEVSTEGREG